MIVVEQFIDRYYFSAFIFDWEYHQIYTYANNLIAKLAVKFCTNRSHRCDMNKNWFAVELEFVGDDIAFVCAIESISNDLRQSIVDCLVEPQNNKYIKLNEIQWKHFIAQKFHSEKQIN